MTNTMQKTQSDKTQPEAGPTKKAQLIRLLKGRHGADAATLSKRLGWQPHTVRAALSGLRKAGCGIAAERAEGKPLRYRITAAPEESNG